MRAVLFVLACLALEAGFAEPPIAVRPSVWWYWSESVTTDHGVGALGNPR